VCQTFGAKEGTGNLIRHRGHPGAGWNVNFGWVSQEEPRWSFYSTG